MNAVSSEEPAPIFHHRCVFPRLFFSFPGGGASRALRPAVGIFRPVARGSHMRDVALVVLNGPEKRRRH